LELIIAGVDKDGPHIYGLMNPGILECFDSIGFYSIGSGSMHAFQSLVATYEPGESIEKTLYETYKAKKDAEIAPGVGKDVDLGIIKQNECIDFTQDHVKIKDLEKFYEKTKETTKKMVENADFSSIINSNEGQKGGGSNEVK
jgi:20S proteasome alpha/beta subunit